MSALGFKADLVVVRVVAKSFLIHLLAHVLARTGHKTRGFTVLDSIVSDDVCKGPFTLSVNINPAMTLVILL